ncbi:MAG TPA: hypothetical protein VE262_04420 [Blastocatellia bacterium]|nr:hypothetical protein [Blastocatellia bacterium]
MAVFVAESIAASGETGAPAGLAEAGAGVAGAAGEGAAALLALTPGELIEFIDTGSAGRRTAAKITSETMAGIKSLGLRNEDEEKNLFMASP